MQKEGRKIFETFAEFLAKKGKEKNTIETYCYSVNSFLRYIEYDLKFTREDVQQYIETLQTASTKVVHTAAINAYCQFKGRPAAMVEYPKRKRNTTNIADDPIFSCIDTFLAAAAEKELYVRVLIYLMLWAGLRVGEVAALSSTDIVIRDGRLVVAVPAQITKGHKKRIAPYIDVETASDVIEYAQENKHLERLSRIKKRGIQAHVQGIAEKIGAKISCHSLRHYYASELLRRGVKLETIQACLGHEDIRTTRRYARTFEDEIISIAALFPSPVDGEG